MPKIHGLNKTTLLDYPGRIAATIFLGHCNFRCPFCQNSALVLNPAAEPEIPEEQVLSFLKNLADKGLIQKAAVDIKACPENYPSLSGLLHPPLDAVRETVDFLLHGNLDYEFRTTVVKELHNEEDFVRIGQWLKGARGYYLQAYKDSEEVLQPGFSSYSLEELEHFRKILLTTIPVVGIRGID